MTRCATTRPATESFRTRAWPRSAKVFWSPSFECLCSKAALPSGENVTFSGGDALFSIQEAIGRARSDEGRLDDALRSAMDEAARLRSEEAEGFRTLAHIRLDTM